jgi:hypothetical protein
MLAERGKRIVNRRSTSAPAPTRTSGPGRTVGFAIAFLTFATSCTESVDLGPPPSAIGSTKSPGLGNKAVSGTSTVPVMADEAGLPVQTRDGWIRGASLTRSDRFARDSYRENLDEQLALYPPAFTERIGLKQVVLCKDLTFEGTGCVAFADVEHGRLYLSINAGFVPAFIRRTIHHEVFHQVDFADDGKLDADPRWEALNAPDFRYSHDAERLQADPESIRPDDTLTGFLNRYGTSSPAEDKAELYAALVVEPDRVRRRVTRDEILRKKVARVREMLDGLGRYAILLIDR